MHTDRYPEDAPPAADTPRVWVDTRVKNSYDWSWLVGVILTLIALATAAIRSYTP